MNSPAVVVTVVQNSPAYPLGSLAASLGDGVRLVRAYAGEQVPSFADAGDGIVVLGGEASAVDVDASPWLVATRALVSEALAGGVPVLGIGLGAQILALTAGGQVQLSAPPGVETGVTTVFWRRGACDDAALSTVVDLTDRTDPVVVHHGDAVVDLPPSVQWLGSSDMYPFQAFRAGSGLGLQFQPEATRDLLEGWVAGLPADERAAALDAFDARAEEITAVGERIGSAYARAVRATADARASASV